MNDLMSNVIGKPAPDAPQRERNPEFHVGYDDLRGWLAAAEKLGEVRIVKGASWQKEIGMAADLVMHSDDAPCLVFDEIPGFPKGHRVLVNFFGGRRKNMTLGFPLGYGKLDLSRRVPRALPARHAAPSRTRKSPRDRSSRTS